MCVVIVTVSHLRVIAVTICHFALLGLLVVQCHFIFASLVHYFGLRYCMLQSGMVGTSRQEVWES